MFLLNQVLQATTHWSIARAVLETILSCREIDTSHFIVGFADPMEPVQDDRGHPIPKTKGPAIPSIPLLRVTETSIVTLTERSGSENIAFSKNQNESTGDEQLHSETSEIIFRG